MNEETKTILNQFLSSLMEGLNKAGAFVTEQLPLVLQEYITWEIASSIVWLVPWTLAAIGCVKLWKWLLSIDDDDADDKELAFLIAAVPSIIAFGAVIYNVLDMCKAIFAPRVYLIEELSKLVK